MFNSESSIKRDGNRTKKYSENNSNEIDFSYLCIQETSKEKKEKMIEAELLKEKGIKNS